MISGVLSHAVVESSRRGISQNSPRRPNSWESGSRMCAEFLGIWLRVFVKSSLALRVSMGRNVQERLNQQPARMASARLRNLGEMRLSG